MKMLSGILLVVILGVMIWVGFGLWTGIYSVYSTPPSRAVPQGETRLVSREGREPIFNSPHIKQAPETQQAKKGIQFGAIDKPKKSIEDRTIIKLPFIQWAYDKSLEGQTRN